MRMKNKTKDKKDKNSKSNRPKSDIGLPDDPLTQGQQILSKSTIVAHAAANNNVTVSVNGKTKEMPWHIAPTQSLSQPNFDKLTLGDFERVTNLGRGGYARVYLVRLKKEPNKTYALKCVIKKRVVDANQRRHVQSEREILLKCRCEFVMQLYRTFRCSKYVYAFGWVNRSNFLSYEIYKCNAIIILFKESTDTSPSLSFPNRSLPRWRTIHVNENSWSLFRKFRSLFSCLRDGGFRLFA